MWSSWLYGTDTEQSLEIAAVFGHCLEFAPLLSTAARSLDLRKDPNHPQRVKILLRNVTPEVVEAAIAHALVDGFKMDRLVVCLPSQAALAAAKLLRGNPNADTLWAQHENDVLSQHVSEGVSPARKKNVARTQ